MKKLLSLLDWVWLVFCIVLVIPLMWNFCKLGVIIMWNFVTDIDMSKHYCFFWQQCF